MQQELCSEIQGFQRQSLTRTQTHDRSVPILVPAQHHTFLAETIDLTTSDVFDSLTHENASDITAEKHSFLFTDDNEEQLVEYYQINCVMEGAKVQIAMPLEWRKCLIIHCHGHRPLGIELQAELNIEKTATYQSFLREGFCVAMTSYRRQGIILADALLDVNNVRDFVISNFPQPDVVILEGRSMGGAIVTYLSEIYPECYHGAVAIGAALHVDQSNETTKLKYSYTPQFPILFLTNVSELGGPQNYTKLARLNAEKGVQDCKEVITPAIWEVYREGHNLVNSKERTSATLSLLNWIQYQTFITVRSKDNTHEMPYQPSQIEYPNDKSGGYGKVVSVDDLFGSFLINFQEEDFEQLFIRQGKSFQMRFAKSKEELLSKESRWFTVYLSAFPFVNVPNNEFMAYYDPETNMTKVGVKTFKYVNPAAMAGVQMESVVWIRRNE